MVQNHEIISISHLLFQQLRGICTEDELIGDWKVIFEGTNYESLKFKIIDKIVPGYEKLF